MGAVTDAIHAATLRFAKRATEARTYQRATDPVGNVFAELDDDGMLSVSGSIRGHDFGVEIHGFPSASWNRYTRRWLESIFIAAANAAPVVVVAPATEAAASSDDPIDGIVRTLCKAFADIDQRLIALEGKAQT